MGQAPSHFSHKIGGASGHQRKQGTSTSANIGRFACRGIAIANKLLNSQNAGLHPDSAARLSPAGSAICNRRRLINLANGASSRRWSSSIFPASWTARQNSATTRAKGLSKLYGAQGRAGFRVRRSGQPSLTEYRGVALMRVISSTTVTGESRSWDEQQPGLGSRGFTIRQQRDDPAPFQKRAIPRRQSRRRSRHKSCAYRTTPASPRSVAERPRVTF
jgi:hypothetical protein